MSDATAPSAARPPHDTEGIHGPELVEIALRLEQLAEQRDALGTWAAERLARVKRAVAHQGDAAERWFSDALAHHGRRPVRTDSSRGSLRDRVSGAVHRILHRAQFAPPPSITPTLDSGCVGLALSGGGIRSATFNLGVLQALAKDGVLPKLDYLSTVSGGGYIGSCLSALLATSDAGLAGWAFPFHHESGTPEPEAMRKLRRGGDYLAPNGLLDMIRIPLMVLRGILMNLLTVAPVVLAAVWLTGMVLGDRLRTFDGQSPLHTWPLVYVLTPWALGVLGVWLLGFYVVTRAGTVWRGQGWDRAPWSLRDSYGHSFGVLALGALAVAGVETLPWLVHVYQYLERTGFWSEKVVPYVLGGLPAVAAFAGSHAANRLDTTRGRRLLALVGLLGPGTVLLAYLALANRVVYGQPGGDATAWLLGGAAAAFAFVFTFGDANASSMHMFYRDRLSKAYLFTVDKMGRVRETDEVDALKLSELSPPDGLAPYHLLNATVNLSRGDDPNLKGRRADFFLFSKHAVGSRYTGYAPTRRMEALDPRLNLGTAMAVSGAAVSPTRGPGTSRPLVFLMALLNLRLARWIKNPRIAGLPTWRHLTTPGQFRLFEELAGQLHGTSSFVNVSDGGHLENLGVYELLRRRCRLIIASDAEQDAKLEFGGLATVIRFARVDMGLQIEFGERDALDKIAQGETHFAVATIDYGDEQKGHLIYLKASLTGDENPYIRKYHAQHEHFPHQSTGDQFFDEEQFEAYRALGYHVARAASLADAFEASLG